METRIISVGISLSTKGVDNASFDTPTSFSDYDAVIINPQAVAALWHTIRPNSKGERITHSYIDGGYGNKLWYLMNKRSGEISKLLSMTGGVVVCFLYPRDEGIIRVYKTGNKYFKQKIDNYSWLPKHKYRYSIKNTDKRKKNTVKHWDFPRGLKISGDSGKNFSFTRNTGFFIPYFERYAEMGAYEATAGPLPPNLTPRPTVLSVNKTGEIISFILPFSKGRIVFLPPPGPPNMNDKPGEALVDSVNEILRAQLVSRPPRWAKRYTLPGESKNLNELKQIERRLNELQTRKNGLLEEQASVGRFKKLLYEKRRQVLNPVVIDAFRALNFKVMDPGKHKKGYDLFMKRNKCVVIGAIDSTESKQTGVTKYRHLIGDLQDYRLSHRDKVKGIFVANTDVYNSPHKRKEQFAEEVVKGCEAQGCCRITTYTLYLIMERLLSISGAKRKKLQQKITEEILSCNTEYKIKR